MLLEGFKDQCPWISMKLKGFPLLVGCRELHSMGGYDAFLEGDSFPAIQWGLGKSFCPWILAE